MNINSINSKALFLLSFFLISPAYSQGFSNSSLDKKLGADNVSGTFLDTTGNTGGGVENASSSMITAIVAIAVFVGFVLAAKALYDMYKASRDGSGYMGPLVTLTIGSALAILPVITFYTSNTIQDLT